MNPDAVKRRQSLKILVSEAFMVVAVIITVIVLVFIVSGYWLNSEFEIKRQGLLQISSLPTGADVYIDGDSSWFQRTNTSKVLSSGEHEVVLKKENYDSWTKTINIKEGLLYKINYPRLFLKDRLVEDVYSPEGVIFATASPDGASLILVNNTMNWTYINLEEEKIIPKEINVSDIVPGEISEDESSAGIFNGEILKADWDYNSSKALLKIKTNDRIEWVLINPKEIKNSVNLTRTFGVDFSNIKIFDNDANSLLVVQNNNLHKIDVPRKSISAIMVKNINDFDFYGSEIIFSALSGEHGEDEYYIGVTKSGDDKIIKLKDSSFPSKVLIMKFYDEKYVLILEENLLVLYKKENLEKIESFELSFSPQNIKVGSEGEFVAAYSGPKIAALDMESITVNEWTTEGESFDWFDVGMVSTVNNGELIVYDYDGLNRRVLASNISAHFPALITNNRYLYYFSDSNLVREWLVPR